MLTFTMFSMAGSSNGGVWGGSGLGEDSVEPPKRKKGKRKKSLGKIQTFVRVVVK